jgi:hypothetical protein
MHTNLTAPLIRLGLESKRRMASRYNAIRGLCILLVLLVGLNSLGCLDSFITTKSHTVLYQVTGSAKSASLTYANESGGTEQQTVAVPWKLEFRRSPGTFVYLSAQKQEEYGTVHVAIYSDGTLLQQAESSEEYGIASASGSVPY